jgi:hypothetical protein
VFGAIDRVVRVENSADETDRYLETICLPHPLPVRGEDGVDCQVHVVFDSDEVTRRHCANEFVALPDRAADGTLLCPVRQLSRDAARDAALHGFFYVADATSSQDECGAPQRLAFTPENLLYILEPFSLRMHCEYAIANLAGAAVLDNPGGVVYLATDSCSVSAQTPSARRKVGAPCNSAPLYADGFDFSESFLDSGSVQCGSGMCLTYHVDGRASSQRDDSEDKPNISCSCRCSSDELEPGPLCSCPQGFSCESILRGGPAAGGYCVDEQLAISND